MPKCNLPPEWQRLDAENRVNMTEEIEIIARFLQYAAFFRHGQEKRKGPLAPLYLEQATVLVSRSATNLRQMLIIALQNN